MALMLMAATIPAAHVESRADGPSAGPEVESVTVRRVHRPVIVQARRGTHADCGNPAPELVEVREDGELRPLTALGPKPQRRVHALLIDTSSSMRPKLDRAVDAAVYYLESLPEEDQALLATFDDNLVLRAPPTTDRQAILSALGRLTVGNLTALWDGLYYTIRYLAPRDAEKVVVVISDGEDSASLPGNTFEEVLGLARRTSDLAVFSVGLDLKASSSSGFSRARNQLTQIATETGGAFLEPVDVLQLRSTFEAVRRRIEQRLYVSYIPAPFGSGPKDHKGGKTFRWREVTVRARPGSRCRVVSLGASRRLAGFSGQFPERSGAWSPGSDDAPTFITPASGERRLVARQHGFVVAAPPADSLASRLPGPQRVLAFLLEHEDLVPPQAIESSGTRPSLMVDGRTFLELRELLGRALYSSFEDYREWAQTRSVARVDAGFDRLLEGLPGAGELLPAQLSALRESVIAREADPERGGAPGLLVEWLGDVDASRAVLELERHLLNELIAGQEEVFASWGRLGEWFPAVTHGRTVTPLVPVLDTRRDVIGFHRFSLPASRPNGGPVFLVPDRPLGWMTVRWLLDDAETARQLRGRALTATSVDYPPVTRREISRHGCRGRLPSSKQVDRVDIRMTRDERELRLIAYHDKPPQDGPIPPAGRPLCMVAQASDGRPLQALTELIARRLSPAGR